VPFRALVVAMTKSEPNRVLKNVNTTTKTVIPAEAGIQKSLILLIQLNRTPAFAGVTARFSTAC
jgi:hypothetical protein